MKKESKIRWILLLFTAGIMFLIWATLIQKSPEQDNEKDIWAKRANQAIRLVKTCKLPGTDGTILQLTTGYLDMVKTSGKVIEFEGWYAFQVNGSLYEAGVGYMANGVRMTAKWDIDLSQKTIKPRNQEALIFSGNNDLLSY